MIKCVFDSPCHYNAHCRDGGNAVACVCRSLCQNSFSLFPSIIVLAALYTIFNNRVASCSCKYSTRVCLDLNQSTIAMVWVLKRWAASSCHHVGSPSRGLLCCEAVLWWFRTRDVGLAAFSSSGFVNMSVPEPCQPCKEVEKDLYDIFCSLWSRRRAITIRPDSVDQFWFWWIYSFLVSE